MTGLRGWLLASLWLGLAVHPGRAQLIIAPSVVDAVLPVSNNRGLTVGVNNAGSTELNCSISITHLDIQANGLPVVSQSDTRSCRDWLTVSPTEFALTPRQDRRIGLTVKIPKDAGGGYYAMLAISAKPIAERDPTTTGSGATLRMGYLNYVPILLTIPSPTMKAALEPQPPQLIDVGPDGFGVAVAVRNSGTLHARLEGALEVRAENGLVLDTLSLGSGYLLPEHRREYAARGGLRLPDGTYRLTCSFAIQGQPGSRRSEHPLIIRDGRPELRELSAADRAALAQTALGFRVSTNTLGLRLGAGSTRTLYAELVNLTDTPLPIRATVVEWVRGPDGQDRCGTFEPTHGRSLGPALTLRQPTLTLAKKGRQRVPLSVTLPAGSRGEYYAAVRFDRADRAASEDPAQIARRAALVQVYAEQTAQPAVRVDRLEVAPNPRSGVDLALSLTNTGNVGLVPGVQFEVYDERDQLVDRFALPAGKLVQAGLGAVLHARCETALARTRHRFVALVGVDGRSRPTATPVELDLGATPAVGGP
ncbi:MAG: hypothetical protein IT204_12180 [Fimbriimonadaceae bacterium]|nr:hypothetical protein [Fimbriimonadaceae bacterium]